MKRESEFIYLQLAKNLREQILSGFIKSGEFLLSEVELAAHYNLSRASVRRALEELAREGLVVKKVGQGTMVSENVSAVKRCSKTLNIIAHTSSAFCDWCMPLVIKKFNEKHPDVSVNILNIPLILYWDIVRDSAKSGVNPDILLVTDYLFREAKYNGSFVNLYEPVKNVQKMIYPKIFNYSNENNFIKAMPVAFSPIFLAYNPGLFNMYHVSEPKGNWNINDFMLTAQKLTLDTNNDGIIDQYGFTILQDITRLLVIALQNGVSFNAANNDIEHFTKTLNLVHDLLYRRHVAILQQSGMLMGPFYSEKAAMTLTSTMGLANLKSSQLSFEPKVAPLPFGSVDSTMLIANSIMIPSGTSSIELAYSFLNTILSTEIQEIMCSMHHFLSVFKTVNSKILGRKYLNTISITKNNIENCYFLHEIFPEPMVLSKIEIELESFWAGLESASYTASRIYSIIKNNNISV